MSCWLLVSAVLAGCEALTSSSGQEPCSHLSCFDLFFERANFGLLELLCFGFSFDLKNFGPTRGPFFDKKVCLVRPLASSMACLDDGSRRLGNNFGLGTGGMKPADFLLRSAAGRLLMSVGMPFCCNALCNSPSLYELESVLYGVLLHTCLPLAAMLHHHNLKIAASGQHWLIWGIIIYFHRSETTSGSDTQLCASAHGAIGGKQVCRSRILTQMCSETTPACSALTRNVIGAERGLSLEF
jgi:hypothetical protein